MSSTNQTLRVWLISGCPAGTKSLRLQLREQNHVADAFLAEEHQAEAASFDLDPSDKKEMVGVIPYRGWGWVVLPIFFLTLWKVQELFPHADPSQWAYWREHWWPQGMSFFLSGAITGVAAWMLRHRGPHHIFYIPVHWWALTFAVAGIGWFVAEMIYFPTTTMHDVLAKLHH